MVFPLSLSLSWLKPIFIILGISGKRASKVIASGFAVISSDNVQLISLKSSSPNILPSSANNKSPLIKETSNKKLLFYLLIFNNFVFLAIYMLIL